MTTEDDLAVLHRAVDQLTALLADVQQEALDQRTPCEDWTVRDLINHIVSAPARFARMVRNESVDWSAAPPSAADDPADRFRANAEELFDAWHGQDGSSAPAVDWQCAELAVHTWDLAEALGHSTAGLDAEVAERGYAFMRGNLTSDNRGSVFGAERPAPENADAYQRIAAFAGRMV